MEAKDMIQVDPEVEKELEEQIRKGEAEESAFRAKWMQQNPQDYERFY